MWWLQEWYGVGRPEEVFFPYVRIRDVPGWISILTYMAYMERL